MGFCFKPIGSSDASHRANEDVMRTKMKTLTSAIALLTVVGFAGPALSGEALDQRVANGFAGFSSAIGATELAATRGTGQDEDFDNLFEASSSGNTAIDAGSVRSNIIVDSAFSGASGIATVIQNAGNNVVIQTATIVTINHY